MRNAQSKDEFTRGAGLQNVVLCFALTTEGPTDESRTIPLGSVNGRTSAVDGRRCTAIRANHVFSGAIRHEASLVEEEAPCADTLNDREVVADQYNRPTLTLDLSDPSQTLPLEFLIPY